MRARRFALGLALTAVAGCETADDMATNVTRDAARNMVDRVVIDRYPGVNVKPVTDCIIDNATSREILGLASDSITGPTEATYQTVGTIISRPETLTCLATAGLPGLLS